MTEFNHNENKSLNIGEVLNHTFEIYKKIALIGGIALLFLSVILIFVSITSINFFSDIKTFAEVMKDFKPENLELKNKSIFILAVTLITTLVSPFSAGLLKMSQDADCNEEIKFSSLWYYINTDRFVHILLATALLTVTNLTLDLSIKSNLENNIGNPLSFVLTSIISINTFISIPLIVFDDLNFLQGISRSFKLISANFFPVVLLIIIGYILACIGLFAFCIGIVFTLPIINSLQYSIYKNLT